MIRRMLLMILLVVLVVAFIGWRKYEGYQGFMAMKAGMAQAKQVISTTTAASEEWGDELEAVGSLRAAKGVDVTNEIAGIVSSIDFTSGSDVKSGTMLIKLRAEDDIAKLHSLEAAARLAEITYRRDKKQLQAQAISQAQVDMDAATLASDRAQVAEQKAIVDKKFIRAPFSGHLGIRNVDLGQYLNSGTAIVTLQQLDPIYLDFTLPQQALSSLHANQKIVIKNDAYPDKTFSGTISAINPRVDAATRNVQVRASLKNPKHLLLPGMYATADIAIGTPGRFITLPQTAITYNPYGDTVFRVVTKSEKERQDAEAKEAAAKDSAAPKGAPKEKESKEPAEKDAKDEGDLVVEQAFVTVGKTRGDQVQILKGVKEGDIIVSAGQLKLQNGAGVTVDNSVVPKDDAHPVIKDQ